MGGEGVRRRLAQVRDLLRRPPGAADPSATSAREPGPATRAPGSFERALVSLTDLLPSRTPRVVVIITAQPGPECDGLIAHVFGGDRVYVVAPPEVGEAAEPGHDHIRLCASNLAEVEAALLLVGGIDLIINLRPVLLEDLAATLLRLFFHLRRGGGYLLDRSLDPDDPDGPWSELSALLERAGPGSRAAPVPVLPAAERELVRSVNRVVVKRRLLLLTKGTTHYLKLRDRDAEDLLRARRTDVQMTVLERRDGASFSSRAVVRHFGTLVRPGSFAAEIDYPPLTARSYRGRIALARNSLLFGDQVVLPESFRFHRAPTLVNERLVDVNEVFARIPRKHHPTDVLPGSYFHVDSPVPGHFGHLMAEVISRLWAWDVAKDNCPDLKAIYRQSAIPERAEVDREVLRAFGIPNEDIVAVDRPVFLESVYSATPMWHNQTPHSVHPDMTTVWRRMRDNLVDPTVAGAPHIFVSRPPGMKNRPCVNAAEVEAYFAGRGFRVVYPEQHSLAEQAQIFAAAEVVAGFGGSGLFNVLFSQHLSRLVVLSQEAYTARNEYLFASLLGCEVDYLWSAPEIAHPKGRWSPEAYQSPWSFDFDLHRRTLDQIL